MRAGLFTQVGFFRSDAHAISVSGAAKPKPRAQTGLPPAR